MNILDLAVLAVMGSAVWGGYRLGLVQGGTSWVFLLQGLVLVSLLTPVLGAIGDAAARMTLGLLLFAGAGIGAQFLGRAAGLQYRRALVPEEYLPTDRAAGAIAGPVAVLLVVWLIVLPPLDQAVGWVGNLADRSAISRALTFALPDPPASSEALRKLVGPVAMPEVLTALGPAGDLSPPPKRADLEPEVVSRITASTVRIEGDACLLEKAGSGFTVAENLVVTNAHVVAGENKAAVVRPDGTRLPATVAVFDPQRDLALLRVPNLDQEPLPLGAAREGTVGAVFGHPAGQDELEISPAAIRQELVADVRSVDLEISTRRSLYVLAADLEPGDSGGALVTPNGTVAGVAFAIARHRNGVAYALTTEELRPLLELDHSGSADTGRCV
ncbi:MAG: CvpA family protein [Actinomycetota bacterium]|nr:CvpA family protein [Actinomycetota bacterium]